MKSELFFGTGGTPHTAKARDSTAGVWRVKELGLGCMELEFVRGVGMGLAKAGEVRRVSEKHGVKLSAHGPYYINLNSNEADKRAASVKRILDTARVGYAAGAESITFHPAYYLKEPPEKVSSVVKDALTEITSTLKDEGVKVWVRPETSGRASQFGSLDELISLSQQVDRVLPCIDFSHLHARDGKVNSLDEFRAVLSKVEDGLGKEAVENMHNHVQGIDYGPNGEKTHLNLNDSDFNYRDLLRAFKEYGAGGRVICESPNLEEDALLLKETYDSID